MAQDTHLDDRADPAVQVNADAALLEEHPPPRSAAATGAFIFALLLVLPWVPLAFLNLVGRQAIATGAAVGMAAAGMVIVLAIIGLVRTAGQRRRGRGLAIAAIPIALCGGLFQGLLGFSLHMMVVAFDHSIVAVELLKTPREELKTASQQWHGEIASARLQAAVTPEELEAWLEQTLDRWGQMQNGKRAKKFWQIEGSGQRYRYVGNFVNGAADVDVVVSMEKGSPKVDDIRVYDSSPLGP